MRSVCVIDLESAAATGGLVRRLKMPEDSPLADCLTLRKKESIR